MKLAAVDIKMPGTIIYATHHAGMKKPAKASLVSFGLQPFQEGCFLLSLITSGDDICFKVSGSLAFC